MVFNYNATLRFKNPDDGCLGDRKSPDVIRFACCEKCPLPQCRYETSDPQVILQWRAWRRRKIIKACSPRLAPWQIAKLLGVTERTVYRALERVEREVTKSVVV